MPTYAVGDIQGCGAQFEQLLEQLAFDGRSDTLWLVGDLVNRGPRSLDVLRRARGLGAACRIVLGNHDLHLLAIHYAGRKPRRGDTLDDVLAAPDRDELCDWLRGMPLLFEDRALGYAMTHAGIPHIWDLAEATRLAREVEAVYQGDGAAGFFESMYGNEPALWQDDLQGTDRWRCITNYFTRMRLLDETGRLDLVSKGGLEDAPAGWSPWFELRARRPLEVRLLFGHWAALKEVTSRNGVIGLDTGCVWGGALTALCLDSGEFSSIPAA